MNIDGLSTATIEAFVNMGIIGSFRDFYHINEHMEEIIALEGFGQKSYDNLWQAIENSRNSPNFIQAGQKNKIFNFVAPVQLTKRRTSAQCTPFQLCRSVFSGLFGSIFAAAGQLTVA